MCGEKSIHCWILRSRKYFYAKQSLLCRKVWGETKRVSCLDFYGFCIWNGEDNMQMQYKYSAVSGYLPRTRRTPEWYCTVLQVVSLLLRKVSAYDSLLLHKIKKAWRPHTMGRQTDTSTCCHPTSEITILSPSHRYAGHAGYILSR